MKICGIVSYCLVWHLYNSAIWGMFIYQWMMGKDGIKMSNLSRFMKQNKTVKENEFYAPTESMTDEKGKPLKWEFRHMTSKENDNLKDNCTLDIQVKGKPNMYRQKLNSSKYLVNMIAACTVTPNLYDKELQDSYGVKTPEDLVYEMVDDPGEYADLCIWLQKYQGFDTSMDDKVEEAKN